MNNFKNWFNKHYDAIAFCAEIAGAITAGCIIGRAIGEASDASFSRGFQKGCSNTILGIMADNKDNPEVIKAACDYTAKYRK